MDRAAILPIVLVLLALDWAALHDIVKGESDLTAEYAVLAVSGAVFCGLALLCLRRRAAS